jgi:hypothetical protein
VHRQYIPIYIQQDATLYSLFISGNCSICFGWYFHPSSGAHSTVSTASGICHTGRSPHAYVNQRLKIQLELLMMSGVPLETCWAFNERWNNLLYYKVASSWLFLLSSLYSIVFPQYRFSCSALPSVFSPSLFQLLLMFCLEMWSNPCSGLDRPWGFQSVEAPWFHDTLDILVYWNTVRSSPNSPH